MTEQDAAALANIGLSNSAGPPKPTTFAEVVLTNSATGDTVTLYKDPTTGDLILRGFRIANLEVCAIWSLVNASRTQATAGAGAGDPSRQRGAGGGEAPRDGEPDGQREEPDRGGAAA